MLSPAAWLRSIVMVLSPSEFERKGLGHSRGISPLSGGPLLIGRLIHQKQHCNRTFRMRVRWPPSCFAWPLEKSKKGLRTGLPTLWTIRIGPQMRQLVCRAYSGIQAPSRWDWIPVHCTHCTALCETKLNGTLRSFLDISEINNELLFS